MTEVLRDRFDGWDDFVMNHPDATVYHLSPWGDVVRKVYRLRTCYLSARSGGKVTGILPLARVGFPFLGRQLVSLPYHMYGGLIAEGEEAEGRLLEAAAGVARELGAGSVELRNCSPVDSSWKAREDKLSVVLDLPEDPEILWKSFSAKVRNQCRKGDKKGLTFEVDPPDALDAFYGIMVTNMRRLGSPVHARAFFAAARESFPDRSRIHVVRSEGMPVAAGFTISFRDKVEIPWASSLWEYNRVCANMFLYWNILRDSIERGAREFDFGRSTRNSGTHKFKLQWGGEEIPLYYQYWTGEDSEEAPAGTRGKAFQLASRVWCRLPEGVTRALGPHLVRRLP
jgi:FemAB-related protein (PEP-CTERM system-associated)